MHLETLALCSIIICNNAIILQHEIHTGGYVGDCPSLLDPQNGMVMMMGRSFGSKAMYSCELGFMLEGEMTRTCQKNGEWSGEEPRCKGMHWLYIMALVQKYHCLVNTYIVLHYST